MYTAYLFGMLLNSGPSGPIFFCWQVPHCVSGQYTCLQDWVMHCDFSKFEQYLEYSNNNEYIIMTKLLIIDLRKSRLFSHFLTIPFALCF